MKIKKLLIFVALITALLTACTLKKDVSPQVNCEIESLSTGIILDNSSTEVMSEVETNELDNLRVDISNGNSEPGICNSRLGEALGFETSSENIEVYSVKEEYTLDEQVLECKVINHNAPDGFYFFGEPYIEFYDTQQWVRFYNNAVVEDKTQWVLCAQENNTTEKNSTVLKVKTANIVQKLVPGQYRFVVFLKDRKVYAYFKIVDVMENEE